MEVVSLADRPDLVPATAELAAGPEFIFHDPVAAEFWHRLIEDFADYQTALLDGGRVVAKGVSIPFHWDRPGDELPGDGWDFALRQGVVDRDAGREPTAACALWIVVAADRLGTGLSATVVQSLRAAAARHGLTTLYAPVRPTRKADYPLIRLEDYASWTLNDGVTPFDPWLRVHWRLGGRILHVCPRSMLIPGTIEDWQRWTGMVLPQSGRYVIPGALVPIEVDHDHDLATYVEPNVWVRHQST
ncbi:MAG: hypothetical protein ACYCZN_12285 [Candidatus Dormibacteria bacterium]